MVYEPINLFELNVLDPNTGMMPQALPVAGRLSPPQIAIAYGLPYATGFGVKVGILSFGGGFLQSDLNKSFADLQTAGLISPKLTVPTVKQVLLDGQTGTFSSSSSASAENTVDIYCVACMAPQADITLYIGNSFASMITRAIADGINIITISWGSSEYTMDEVYFAQAEAANITVLAASGDSGSTVSTSSNSVGVIYPSSSPKVLSVGGTKLTLNANNTRASETDDNRDPSFGSTWGGGGGISSVFTAPTFQAGLTYIPITNGVTGSPTALTTRGTPDIAAPMNVYALYFNGVISGFGGTSLSSPVLAGIIARNLQLSGNPKSSKAYNTFAYSTPSAFYDITTGTNNTVITSGYQASSGWDPVTGLGPPIGSAFYQAVRTGIAYPKNNYGTRTGYPRPSQGKRTIANTYVIPFTGATISAFATNAQLGGRLDWTGSANTNSNVSTTWSFTTNTVTATVTGIPYHSYYSSAAANIPGIQNYTKTWTYRGGTNVSGTQPNTGAGKIGLWLNGVSMFNPSAQGGAPGGYPTYPNWHYNAAYEAGEEYGYSFGEDRAGAHAAPPNEYHYHDGSMIISGAWALGTGHTSGSYGATGLAEVNVIPYLGGSLTHPDGHSKIMGIAADGYPVYGPYGYSSATNMLSTVRRMVPGYALNPTYVSQGFRTTNGPTPPINSQYPLGIFVEDWSFVGGGDLDTYNGRYCKTPDYPNGTYAYFLAFNSSMKPTYPYVIGNKYYGTPATL